MRRWTGPLAAAVVLASLIPLARVGAAQTKKRETKPYAIATGNAVNTVAFTPPKGTAFVLVEINDRGASAAALQTRGSACQDTNGNNTCGEAGEASREFCNKTSTPIAIVDSKDVLVFVSAADTCGSNQPALGTTGTVTVTYIITKAQTKKPTPAFAKVPKKTQTAMYSIPLDAEGTGFSVEGVMPPAGAGFVSFKITDSVAPGLGRPTAGALGQDTNGDNVVDTYNFCNETTTPVPVLPELEVVFFVEAFSVTGTGCSPGDLALGTSGTITITWYITGAKAPVKLREVGKKNVSWQAPVPCAAAGCPYLSFRDTATGESACTRSPQFSPPGSWADVNVKVPAKVGGRVPQAIVVRISPSVDWDLFVCRLEHGDYVYAGNGEPPPDCSVGCKEEAKVSVLPGQTLLLRAWNFSDANATLQGQYAWLIPAK